MQEKIPICLLLFWLNKGHPRNARASIMDHIASRCCRLPEKIDGRNGRYVLDRDTLGSAAVGDCLVEGRADHRSAKLVEAVLIACWSI